MKDSIMIFLVILGLSTIAQNSKGKGLENRVKNEAKDQKNETEEYVDDAAQDMQQKGISEEEYNEKKERINKAEECITEAENKAEAAKEKARENVERP